jgi:Ca-activated chloride channel homolog
MKAKHLILVMILLSSFGSTKYKIIKGTVTDSARQPLVGVTIAVKGTDKSTYTDQQGQYAIHAPESARYLRFSYIGYMTKEVKLDTAKTLNVVLSEDSRSLSEIVVTGYGRLANRAATAMKRESLPVASMYDATMIERNTESYAGIRENGFQLVQQNPVTTFSADVDRAAYSNVRRFLNMGQLPPTDAVRIEEMINYFDYQYSQPVGADPISITTEISQSPWNPALKLAHIGLQARTIPQENLPASNLVFLIDVSGSMNDPNKLPLLKQAFKMLTDQLRAQDKVSIVVYAGAAGVVLQSTSGSNKLKIKEALENLEAGGSTAGGQGIELAYTMARQNFIQGGNNRVVLATDGDFNVGLSSESELEKLIEEKRKGGVFLSVVGFGSGNYKDSHMEKIADKGNGNYAYIDNIFEAQKVLVHEFGGTMYTVAKDVKLQVEFNPKHVQAYRLIGYENRALKNEEFHDDRKDAGDMGSGHSVTAIYEIVPTGVKTNYLNNNDPLKYQQTTPKGSSEELLTVKIRYKKPDSDKSALIEHPVKNQNINPDLTSENFRFAASVAEFGLLLRQSEFKGNASYSAVASRAKAALGKDEEGYRAEFVRLAKLAQTLDSRPESIEVTRK